MMSGTAMWRVCIAPLPYSIGFLIYVISEWFANIIVGTVLAVVFLRVLHVVKYEQMIALDPEEWSRKIQLAIMGFYAMIVAIPVPLQLKGGDVYPHLSFYTGYATHQKMNPHAILLAVNTFFVATITLGCYIFTKFYLRVTKKDLYISLEVYKYKKFEFVARNHGSFA
ncbi:uncharacterized protein LOC111703151 [Eurytemora carolleeae]|uniref:uncharacterized protein LOC111703151 n=1 Tax=Eurytemora carolleeae TaxID=1294199 RepID=UPI000C774569|nr:uncharacterized protein LOC111703151 [Eurytemora carolleeae]|eukprot:XP_023330794.1 uncharacterized protein LOC111703151 [Eurytemora affinis]